MIVRANSSAAAHGRRRLLRAGYLETSEERLTSKVMHTVLEIDDAGSPGRPQDLLHRANTRQQLR
jgi:hypothetical protein